MQELSLIEIIKYSCLSLVNSKVFILLILEALILLVSFIFRKLMNKKIVNKTCLIASLIVLVFYISNYVNTLITFVNNVSTRFIELMYFPTTLEFTLVMIISFVIMLVTLLNRKSKLIVKVVNTSLPIIISFLFLSIIEYINTNNIAFDEFSVFTNPILMSLYELAMGIFISWLICLVVYKIDLFIISMINTKEVETKVEDNNSIVVESEEEEVLELPKLKA